MIFQNFNLSLEARLLLTSELWLKEGNILQSPYFAKT